MPPRPLTTTLTETSAPRAAIHQLSRAVQETWRTWPTFMTQSTATSPAQVCGDALGYRRRGSS
eukprot:10070976-Lingulodinium_polyedra.AAC.1